MTAVIQDVVTRINIGTTRRRRPVEVPVLRILVAQLQLAYATVRKLAPDYVPNYRHPIQVQADVPEILGKLEFNGAPLDAELMVYLLVALRLLHQRGLPEGIWGVRIGIVTEAGVRLQLQKFAIEPTSA